MTGLHAGHVLAGCAILGWCAIRARRGAYGAAREAHVGLEMGTLYWHFVDLVWLFLWPMFYLVRR
jgi:nitric oxide reductase NorE protein